MELRNLLKEAFISGYDNCLVHNNKQKQDKKWDAILMLLGMVSSSGYTILELNNKNKAIIE